MKGEFKNLPSGWKVVKLGDVFDFLKTYTNSRESLNDYDEISYIHYGEIHKKYKFYLDFCVASLPKIHQSKLGDKPEFIKNGDLVIADASEDYIDIAKSVEIKNLEHKAVAGLHTFLLRDKGDYFADGYKGYILYEPWVAKELKKKATGISVLGISKSNLLNLKIKLPPLDEQKKIAKILSTWDEAINLTINLIENKKQFKKALMQNLLTAKIRFPEFQDEWREIKLGDFLEEKSERNTKNIDLILSVTNKFGFVTQVEYFDKSVASDNTANYKIVRKGNFAYNPSRINVGSIALLESYEIGILSPMYVVFECLKNLDNRFLKFWFQSHIFMGNLPKYLAGSVRESLNFNDMKTISIKLPNLKEQQKIAEVLTACDDEINLLNLKLENLKRQKQGLMQKLLSAKVRTK